MAQPKVFVSHSHVDDAFAERLVKDLRAAGADAWLDKTDLGAGDFQARISAALGGCEWFVLVLTRSALASKWVVQEVNAANSLKHQGRIQDLIFIQAGPIEHHELPALWSVYNIFDATADYATTRDRVATTVGVTRPRPSISPLSPQATPGGAKADALQMMRQRQPGGTTGDPALDMLHQLIFGDLVQSQYADALSACERGLKDYPNDLVLWRSKAMALRELGRYPEADVAAQTVKRLGG